MKGGSDWRTNEITTLDALIEKRLEYGICKYIGGELHKKCDCCKVFRPMNEEGFLPNARRLDGLEFGCRECMGLSKFERQSRKARRQLRVAGGWFEVRA